MAHAETEIELEFPFPSFHVKTSHDDAKDFSFKERVRVLNRTIELCHGRFYGEADAPPYEYDRDVEAAVQCILMQWYCDPLMPREFPPMFFWAASAMDDRTVKLNVREGCVGLSPWLDFLNRSMRQHLGLYLKGYILHRDYPMDRGVAVFYAPLKEHPLTYTLDQVLQACFVNVLNLSTYEPTYIESNVDKTPRKTLDIRNAPALPAERTSKPKKTLIIRDKSHVNKVQ